MKRTPVLVVVGYALMVFMAGFLTRHAGHAYYRPIPLPELPALVVTHYGAPTGDLTPPTRLDIAYDTFPGTYGEAVTDCLSSGGEPISYSADADLMGLVCEDMDY